MRRTACEISCSVLSELDGRQIFLRPDLMCATPVSPCEVEGVNNDARHVGSPH